MNFALTTLTVIIFALPGFVLRKSYYSEDFSTNHRRSNLTEDVFWAVIPSLFIHSFIRLFLVLFTRYDLNFEVIGYLLSGGNNYQHLKLAFENIGEYHFEIVIYYTLVLLFC